MAVYRRGETWWFKFYFAGKYIRESAKTSSRTIAKEAEKQRRRELEEGYNGITGADRSKRVQTISEAADELLTDYALRRSPNSVRYLKQRLAQLNKHMGDMMLIEISNETIAEYQNVRLKEGASGSSINNEVMFALHMMGDIGDAVRLKLRREKRLRLPKNENCGKALDLKQEDALLTAAQVPEVPEGEKVNLKATRSPMIYPAIMLALNTTMRESEVRTLRWEQVDFLKRIITVGKAKTSAGSGRTIPINAELYRALANHKAWFEAKVRAVAPELYVFPFGDCRKYHPERPISSFKTSWTNVRNKAGLSIRFHDLRHTAITKLAESGAGDETIRAIAGHVSRAMLSRYAHIRTQAKRTALEAISTKPVFEATDPQTARVAS
jgi:integrase